VTFTNPVRYCACVWVCSAAIAPPAAQDVGPVPSPDASLPERVAAVQLRAAKTTYYVNEELRLELRFGFERGFLEADLVQLFHRELDLSVQLVAPWIDALPGARAAPSEPPPGEPTVSVALNEERALARRVDEQPAGRPGFEMFAIEVRTLPERPGKLSLPAPAMRFAYATRFREDLFGGRVAEDRIETSVRGSTLELEVLPLPEAGRPADFSGAVGTFSVRAQAEPRDLSANQSLKLELAIEGRGNYETLLAPRLDRLTGFRVYGKVEEQSPGRRTVTYDLAPLSAQVKAVPPIAFSYFDPNPPAGYRSVETRAIPILVRPAPLDPSSEDPPADEDHATGDAGGSAWPWTIGAAGLAAVALVAWACGRSAKTRKRIEDTGTKL
jgi:hypothetical protein